MLTLSRMGVRGTAGISATLTAGMIALAIAACSSSNASPPAPGASCLSAPSMCPSGQTCWPVDKALDFSCIPSQPKGAFGSACNDSIGVATCSDGQTCDSTSSGMAGTCTLYCDPIEGPLCPYGFTCFSTNVGGPTGPSIKVCRATPASDAGTSNDGGFMGVDGGPPPDNIIDGGGYVPTDGPVQM